MIDGLVCAWRVVGGHGDSQCVRADMFYISSSSDANACRSACKSEVVISQPSLFFEDRGL